MAAPHAIHDEFPGDADLIHGLKLRDAHFARLLDEYDRVNDQVHSAEALIHPISEDAERGLRRQRTHLKDEIARMLSTARAG